MPAFKRVLAALSVLLAIGAGIIALEPVTDLQFGTHSATLEAIEKPPIYEDPGWKWLDRNMECPKSCDNSEYDCPCYE